MPKGHLPVFSVDTEEEAKELIVGACQTDTAGNYYAQDLVFEQTLENLEKFGGKIATVHHRLVELGKCECKKKKGQVK